MGVHAVFGAIVFLALTFVRGAAGARLRNTVAREFWLTTVLVVALPTPAASGGGGLGLALGAAGITGAALIAAHLLRKRRRRSFSAGRARR